MKIISNIKMIKYYLLPLIDVILRVIGIKYIFTITRENYLIQPILYLLDIILKTV